MHRHLAIVATAAAAGGTLYACHKLEGQLRPLDSSCAAKTVPAAINCLKKSGVTVVEGLRLDSNLVMDTMGMKAAESMPTKKLKSSSGSSRRRGVTISKEQEQQEKMWRLSAIGRYHCRDEDKFDANDMKVLERVEKEIWPVVDEFFRAEEEGMEGVYRSEMQLMTAVPGSTHQAWHKDNRGRGLSIIVPLVDFTAENGGTQLLLGSHESSCPVGSDQGAKVVIAPAGSVVAYDSRTIHRGLGNDTKKGRPALIFCYDRERTPPPGTGTAGSIGTGLQGRVLDIVSKAVGQVAAGGD
ncbi:hypothetical protein TrST_g11471 [Triparma strigata]|uniref:Uncharacterized protein n=1 Tax=Triparma strigata TaxID=1606541 RepID=A0A9W7ABN1_9STRA|nr:hypothetical protein TrST_g11471 [Triparma strigata]